LTYGEAPINTPTGTPMTTTKNTDTATRDEDQSRASTNVPSEVRRTNVDTTFHGAGRNAGVTHPAPVTMPQAANTTKMPVAPKILLVEPLMD